ncbi:MAG: hypothetical protein M1816_003556 [Peltula sp. TS41687]|nr:MAG: hypothetical protein M1816_003556 [Peltula sp. TS41687]
MTSIDDLFKGPNVNWNLRKIQVCQAAYSKLVNIAKTKLDEIYKFSKMTANGSPKGKGRASVVDDDDEDDTAAGPELPPPDEVDFGPTEEDDRFFGGGITKHTAEILDFMDERGDDDAAAEKFDSAWLRKLALSFERRVSKNAELRAKFEAEPQKFMSSEADLDSEIKALSILSEHPELYEEFVKLGCVNSLVGLLSHENTDIAIDAIQIISELTDEDAEADEAEWDTLVKAMLEADLLELLVQNLGRLDEDNEPDRQGVYHALNVLENLTSQARISEKIGLETSVMSWLLKRMQLRESPLSQNKQYAAELLEILLQSALTNRKRLLELDGLDVLLQLLSGYRKRDPQKGTEEEEYMENLFASLTYVVRESEGKRQFVEFEGVELCLIMLREGKTSKPRALRLLDHALQGPDGGIVGERMVEAAGLKPLFGMIMKKQDGPSTEHLLGILSALLQSLPANSAARIRLLAKFVEKEYEKIERLFRLRGEYATKVATVDKEIERERAGMTSVDQEDREGGWLSRRLDAGLFCVQSIDLIFAWLIAEDDGAKSKIQSVLANKDESFALIKASLQEQLQSLSNSEDEADETKEMLNTLMGFL